MMSPESQTQSLDCSAFSSAFAPGRAVRAVCLLATPRGPPDGLGPTFPAGGRPGGRGATVSVLRRHAERKGAMPDAVGAPASANTGGVLDGSACKPAFKSTPSP